MKILLTILTFLVLTNFVNAQFIGPKALPEKRINARALGATEAAITKNFFRPAIGITASISDGTAIAGGIGISFEHDRWNDAGQAWAPQYSLAAIAFLNSRGSFIAGVAIGVLGLINVGVGYDFVTKGAVFMPGVQIKF